MARLVGILVIGLVVIAIVGFYQGWFRLDTVNADGRSSVTISVDKGKLQQSEQKILHPNAGK